MTRYKGRTKTSLIERDFPHRVEMIVPEGGFGKRLDEMHEWHRARGIQAMFGRSRRDSIRVPEMSFDTRATNFFTAGTHGKSSSSNGTEGSPSFRHALTFYSCCSRVGGKNEYC